MKEIIIHQENNNQIIVTDDDDTMLDAYSKKISVVFEASNVTILETTSGCIIFRPHKISSIKVRNLNTIEEKFTEIQKTSEKIKESKTEILENEDIITDGE